MTRRASVVLLAVMVTACGAPRPATPDLGADLAGYAPEPLVTGGASVILPEGFHLPASFSIVRPAGFPSLAELEPTVTASALPHQRARITSCLGVVAGGELLTEPGVDSSRLNQQMTITYFDGVVVWEEPAGMRMVFLPDAGGFYQDGDGDWQEATGFEWTVHGPLTDWSMAQQAAADVVAARPAIVGYELVAGVGTVHLALVQGSDRADVWIDETGAALRIVQSFIGPDGASRWLGVWSVETLDPELGPLP